MTRRNAAKPVARLTPPDPPDPRWVGRGQLLLTTWDEDGEHIICGSTQTAWASPNALTLRLTPTPGGTVPAFGVLIILVGEDAPAPTLAMD
jgi:hypothetical protein